MLDVKLCVRNLVVLVVGADSEARTEDNYPKKSLGSLFTPETRRSTSRGGTPKIFGSIDVGPGPTQHTKKNAGVPPTIFNIFQP